MSSRILFATLSIVVIAATTPAASLPRIPFPPTQPEGAVVFEGAGNAHGMGLAMDGVLGQARAGWSYTKILDLFYPGTAFSQASGPIRVGLAEANEHVVELPGGGTVTTGARTSRLPPGASVAVGWTGSAYTVRFPGLVGAAQEEQPVPVPTAEPSARPDPGPVEPTPSPTPEPSATASPAIEDASTSTEPVRIHPEGSPAVSRLAATGRRYRGGLEIKWANGSLWAVNHVDLETYVQGIAEEKGAGWPVEGLKVLAVAARSLAIATTTWYTRRHVNGFDICATSMCQVYLGYDGEEPSMIQATQQTAGQILTYDGRAILAMYHGNGGGQTDTYRLIYGDGVTNAHPYLRSVTYPFAKPLRWNVSFTPEQVTAALRAGGVAVPGAFRTIEVLETGESPRVRSVRVVGTDGSVETTGHAFRAALDLPSIWFDLAEQEAESPPPPLPPEPAVSAGGDVAAPKPPVAVTPTRASGAGAAPSVRIGALAVLLLAVALAGAVRRLS